MKAVWIDLDDDYRIDYYMDIHPSDAIFTGNESECENFILEAEK